MSEFGGLWKPWSNPACTESVKSLHNAEVGHGTKEEEEEEPSNYRVTTERVWELQPGCAAFAGQPVEEAGPLFGAHQVRRFLAVRPLQRLCGHLPLGRHHRYWARWYWSGPGHQPEGMCAGVVVAVPWYCCQLTKLACRLHERGR